MKLRTDQREVPSPKDAAPKAPALPVSVRSLDVKEPKIISQAEREIISELEYQPPETNLNMKLPNLKDVGRVVTKIGTVVPNPISTAVNTINKVAEMAKPQPPKRPGLNLPQPPVNINPSSPKLVDPNPKPSKGWFMTTYENTFNNGITGKQLVWGVAGIATVLILMKTNVGRKVKRMFGGR